MNPYVVGAGVAVDICGIIVIIYTALIEEQTQTNAMIFWLLGIILIILGAYIAVIKWLFIHNSFRIAKWASVHWRFNIFRFEKRQSATLTIGHFKSPCVCYTLLVINFFGLIHFNKRIEIYINMHIICKNIPKNNTGRHNYAKHKKTF